MTDKDTPLEALAKRQQPITDVVYGNDHPSKTPPQKPRAADAKRGSSGSLVKDIVPADTLHKLEALHGKLLAHENRR